MKRYIALCYLMSTAGCATMINGMSTDIDISSDPPGAEILVDNLPVGRTPMRAPIPNGGLRHVQLKKDGYETAHATLEGGFSGWSLFGGPLGILVDLISGGLYPLDEDEKVRTTLKPEQPSQKSTM